MWVNMKVYDRALKSEMAHSNSFFALFKFGNKNV